MENLVAAQRSLRASLERTQAVATALDTAGLRLDEISRRLPSLEAALRPVRARKEALLAVGRHIDRAVGPAAAVLRVFDAVHGLEALLFSDRAMISPATSLSSGRLEEALFFLAGNCNLAIQWLEDMVDHLEENSLADSGFLAILRGSLLSLKNSSPLSMGASSAPPSAASSPSSAGCWRRTKLVLILERLSANGRLENCIRIYTAERVSVLRASLSSLDLDYLEKIANSELDDVRSIEDSFIRWREHLEFAVKHLFESEYKLCSELLGACGPPELWMGCFAEIASQPGITAFLRFGMRVTESQNDPIKLLKLLEIFSTLDKLRVDFNRLFGGKPCGEIKSLTRDLIKRSSMGPATSSGSSWFRWSCSGRCPPRPWERPQARTFITGYCNTLLGEEYSRISTGQIWESFWGGMAEGHRHYRDYYMELYLRQSWRKLPGLLSREGLALLSSGGGGGGSTERDLVKKRLWAFNEAFDEIYRKHSRWVIPEKDLREELCNLIAEILVPRYRIYMKNYGPLVEKEESAHKYAKHTVKSLESIICSLFQHSPGNHRDSKTDPPMGRSMTLSTQPGFIILLPLLYNMNSPVGYTQDQRMNIVRGAEEPGGSNSSSSNSNSRGENRCPDFVPFLLPSYIFPSCSFLPRNRESMLEAVERLRIRIYPICASDCISSDYLSSMMPYCLVPAKHSVGMMIIGLWEAL
ncbi:unnamed protein product [Spirodela intermedia]|uniref:Exocyst subunit Exo70 family protein n=1 Tax=Spirodela intermedia TaxID=51605 RepID=A0A7I8IWY9_SPIIN|nr:unnamed protein product [Spirodela intermedia]CAA6662340.1 unnamed protein product [Spirodela intermedia]